MLKNLTNKITQKIINQLDDNLRPLGLSIQPPSLDYREGDFIVSTTTRCNFHCSHCLRQQVDKDKTLIKDLPVPVFETILKEGKKINFRLISFSGGEPILHPQFRELVDLVKKYDYRFNFASNGWLYKEYWEIIRQNRENLEVIILSLDGVTAEVHDAVRNKPGSFGRLIEAAKFYRGHNLPMMATFCATKKNYHQIEELPQLCLKLGIKSIKWATILLVSENSAALIAKDILTDGERMAALRKIFNLREKFKGQCRFSITSSFYANSGDFDGTADSRKRLGIDFCSVLGNNLFFIDHEGGMFFCCDIFEDCPQKPLVQKIGFAKSLMITMDVVNEIKKRMLVCLLNNPQKIGRICDFCNGNIKSCLDSTLRRQRQF